MSKNRVGVIDLVDAKEVELCGGKAVNLGEMLRSGLSVPNGFVVGLGAFDDDGRLTVAAREKINQKLSDKKYAVRSSATSEDAANASWAGQFETYLNVEPSGVLDKVEQCHNFAGERAKSYADAKTGETKFQVAVVVQEMLAPKYTGVLFTKNPVSNEKKFITEYVEGLGESLVSGAVTPKRIEWQVGDQPKAPFDIETLTNLAVETEKVFGAAQDIEWALADGKVWLVQARPITTVAETRQNFDLGEPADLFYWGPSRAVPLYMGDFMAGIERFFDECLVSKTMPRPPKTLVLFFDSKMVWLNNAKDFSNFTERIFDEYSKQNRLTRDLENWRNLSKELPNLTGADFDEKLIRAWQTTEFAEFALYGAEKSISKKLARFDERTRAKVWAAFAMSDRPSFLNLLDDELAKSRNVEAMAARYAWIRDGYAGPNDEAEWYFAERLKAIDKNGLIEFSDHDDERQQLAKAHSLSDEEIKMLDLARQLAEFLDQRKEWMMKTRRLIIRPVTKIQHGWFFDGKKVKLVGKKDTEMIWQRYIDFRSASSAVKGTVANTGGGQHFMTGEVAVLNSHTDPVADDKILVVPSTSPGWVPLMRRARALVTDHGGMMSHAAIVAREFGLPCIVGVGNGTKVLKTGDKVVINLVLGEIII